MVGQVACRLLILLDGLSDTETWPAQEHELLVNGILRHFLGLVRPPAHALAHLHHSSELHIEASEMDKLDSVVHTRPQPCYTAVSLKLPAPTLRQRRCRNQNCVSLATRPEIRLIHTPPDPALWLQRIRSK